MASGNPSAMQHAAIHMSLIGRGRPALRVSADSLLQVREMASSNHSLGTRPSQASIPSRALRPPTRPTNRHERDAQDLRRQGPRHRSHRLPSHDRGGDVRLDHHHAHELRGSLTPIGVMLRQELLVLLVRDRHMAEVVRTVTEHRRTQLPYLLLQRPLCRPPRCLTRLFNPAKAHRTPANRPPQAGGPPQPPSRRRPASCPLRARCLVSSGSDRSRTATRGTADQAGAPPSMSR